MPNNKGFSVPEPRTSNRQHREAGQQDQPTAQLLPENGNGFCTAGRGKIPCEGQEGRENL